MKKNNKYRNNNSNQIYSLNYKFDSISIAGKISGTALELIKKYNELAKEAHANGDIVTSEVFKQYAEHYRKIVTDINEKKNNQKVVAFPKVENIENSENPENQENNIDQEFNLISDQDHEDIHSIIAAELEAPIEAENTEVAKKEFKIIEISETHEELPAVEVESSELKAKPRTRRVSRKKAETSIENNNDDSAKAEDIAI